MDLVPDFVSEESEAAIPALEIVPEIVPDAAFEEALSIAQSLDDASLAAEVILSGLDGQGSIGPYQQRLLEASPPGGIMLFRYNLDLDKDAIAPFLASVSSLIESKALPPFMALDHEGGEVNRFNAQVGTLPAAASYWKRVQRGETEEEVIQSIEDDARRSGLEIQALGINMNLAPVAEMLSDDNSAFLSSRSYGPDASFVEKAVAAFIRGMKDAKVLSVVKHFPGQAWGDPHTGPVSLPGSRAEVESLAAPMIHLIQRGQIEALMISHALVPALDDKRIASLSPRIMQDWLRDELGFKGLIIADDFSMSGAAASGLDAITAAVTALIAGADMVMAWPKDLLTLQSAILTALEDGRLPRERLEEAAAAVIQLKVRYGIMP